MRADAMLEAGDLGGYAVWKRVLRAVGDLQGTKPKSGERLRIRNPKFNVRPLRQIAQDLADFLR